MREEAREREEDAALLEAFGPLGSDEGGANDEIDEDIEKEVWGGANEEAIEELGSLVTPVPLNN